MRADMQRVVEELVSTYFEQSNEELCVYEVLWELQGENRFSGYSPAEKVEMFREAVERLDGWDGLEWYDEEYGEDLWKIFADKKLLEMIEGV